MNKVVHLGLGSLLALGMTSQAFAASVVGTGPDNPAPLVSVAKGSVLGNAGGAYSYYTINYPGNNVPATLTLNYAPTDPSIANAVGVTVWQNGNQLASVNGTNGTDAGTSTLAFSSDQAGPVLVQVYNYDPTQKLNYELDLAEPPVGSGESAASAPAVVTAPSSAAVAPAVVSSKSGPAGTAENPILLTKPMNGSLDGSQAGSFVYYTMNYQGDGSGQAISLSFSPSSGDVANGVFANVYQNGQLLGTVQGTNSTEDNPGQVEVSFFSTTAGPVLIQIANYNDGGTISYTVSG